MIKKDIKFNSEKYDENMERIDALTQKLWKSITNIAFLITELLEMIFCALLMIPNFILPIYHANAFGGLLYIALGIIIIFGLIKPLVMQYAPLFTFLLVIFACQNIGSFSFVWAFIGAVVIAFYFYQGIKTFINLQKRNDR